jgi:aspartyl protease family protein
MGHVRIKGVVANTRDRSRSESIEFLADTGSIYTMIPGSVLKRLGVEKTGVRRFKIASGDVREYPVGEAYIEIEGLGATSIVIFGPEEATALLGVTSLELLGLQVDPLTGRLKPLELLLLRLLRDRKLIQVEQDFLDRSMRTVGEYESQRWDLILRDHDINSSAVLEHERKYSLEVFPRLLNEWIEFAEKHLEGIASAIETIGEYVDISTSERYYTA